jgi:hypothetical protein
MTGARQTAAVLWICVALFAFRVIAQVEVLLLQPAWLPAMDAWYSGLLPYPLLLPAQIAILALMAVVAWNPRVRRGHFARAHPWIARGLRTFAVLYFLVMSARFLWIVEHHGGEYWREGAIPVAFHWVLALFVLVSGRRRTAERIEDDQEAEELPYGDVPALAPPLLTSAARARR